MNYLHDERRGVNRSFGMEGSLGEKLRQADSLSHYRASHVSSERESEKKTLTFMVHGLRHSGHQGVPSRSPLHDYPPAQMGAPQCTSGQGLKTLRTHRAFRAIRTKTLQCAMALRAVQSN